MTSLDPEITEQTGPHPAPDRDRSWVRTLVISVIAVGVLVTAALITQDESSSISADESAEASTADEGATGEGTASATNPIFALPFTTADGSTSTLDQYRGEPLVVNFFASWCPPCRAELPDLEAVHQKLGDEVTFVGVNQDFTEETWKSFIEESQISYDTVFQPQSEIWSEVGTQAMPTTIFVSADGEVAQVWAGLITEEKLEEVIVETLLEPSS